MSVAVEPRHHPSARRKPRRWRSLVTILGALLLSGAAEAAPSADDDLLSEAAALLAAGASSLALGLIEAQQPASAASYAVWVRWEQQRIAALKAERKWRQISDRLAKRPRGLPAEFEGWAETELAAAWLQLGEGGSARARLRSLLWRSPRAPMAPDLVPRWRRMVIESYLVDGRFDDAYTATLRYDLDYGDAEKEWRLVRARVLLGVERTAELVRLTAGAATDEERVYSLLARARTGGLSVVELFAEAEAQVDNPGLPADLRYRLWAEIARKAARAKNPFLRVRALEGALALRYLASDRRGAGVIDGDALWESYLEYALVIGNAERLLVGRDEGWLALARAVRAAEPIKARAIYAHVARRAANISAGDAAEREFLELLAGADGAPQILRELYLESKRFPGIDAVPEPARLVLAEHAGDELELAARLLRGLGAEPGGSPTPAWALRRVRVLLWTGRQPAAIRRLRDLFSEAEAVPPEALPLAWSVLSELQRAGEPGTAAELLLTIASRVPSPAERREMFYAAAEWLSEAGRYEEAARMFFKAIPKVGAADSDVWARLAHYRAGMALVRAGRIRDGRRVFLTLLDRTREPEARARIERVIGRLSARGVRNAR